MLIANPRNVNAPWSVRSPLMTGLHVLSGHESPLRHRATVASCRSCGHAILWSVEAASEEEALRLLPAYVAARTTVARVSKVEIP